MPLVVTSQLSRDLSCRKHDASQSKNTLLNRAGSSAPAAAVRQAVQCHCANVWRIKVDGKRLGGLPNESDPIMDCLGCNMIETSPVTLRDGRIVCSSCECWRFECEARYVLTKPDAEKRAYLEAIGKKRGEAARQELRQEMIALQRQKNNF